MAFLLHLSLGVNENQKGMICVNNCFLTQDVVAPLLEFLDYVVEFLVIGVIVSFSIIQVF